MKIKELEAKVAELQRRIELMEQREANRLPLPPMPWFVQPQQPTWNPPAFEPYGGTFCGNRTVADTPVTSLS